MPAIWLVRQCSTEESAAEWYRKLRAQGIAAKPPVKKVRLGGKAYWEVEYPAVPENVGSADRDWPKGW